MKILIVLFALVTVIGCASTKTARKPAGDEIGNLPSDTTLSELWELYMKHQSQPPAEERYHNNDLPKVSDVKFVCKDGKSSITVMKGSELYVNRRGLYYYSYRDCRVLNETLFKEVIYREY